MLHRKLEFAMPAPSAVVFDAFHFHAWRHQWDSLVSATAVQTGEPCPYKGAITESTGGGWKRGLSMRTEFVAFDRPHMAAASMLGTSFPFTRWAASMRHRDLPAGQSLLVYTYTFDVGPAWAAWLLEPVVGFFFLQQTHKRFARLSRFLAHHATAVAHWQSAREIELGRPSHDSA